PSRASRPAWRPSASRSTPDPSAPADTASTAAASAGASPAPARPVDNRRFMDGVPPVSTRARVRLPAPLTVQVPLDPIEPGLGVLGGGVVGELGAQPLIRFGGVGPLGELFVRFSRLQQRGGLPGGAS